VVGSTGPLFVAGLSVALLGDRPTLRTLLTGVTAALGVSLVVLKAAGALDPVGVLAALASTASMSTGTVLTQRWGRPDGVGPLALTAWQLTAGGLLIAPVALVVEGAPPVLDGRAIGGYLYLALANTAVAYWLWFRGIGRLTATQVTFLGPLSPLTAAVIGWAALGQALTPVQSAGMALAFGATVSGQFGARTAAAGPAPASRANPLRRTSYRKQPYSTARTWTRATSGSSNAAVKASSNTAGSPTSCPPRMCPSAE
jgi:probable blue pigment (indigoidine) exporter